LAEGGGIARGGRRSPSASLRTEVCESSKIAARFCRTQVGWLGPSWHSPCGRAARVQIRSGEFVVRTPKLHPKL